MPEKGQNMDRAGWSKAQLQFRIQASVPDTLHGRQDKTPASNHKQTLTAETRVRHALKIGKRE